MDKKVFKQSGLPVRKTVDLLPDIFKSPSNDKFLGATLDSLVQPGSLERLSGYIGRSYGKTFNSKDLYLDSAPSLRHAYQLEPGVVVSSNNRTSRFYDYIDFKNQQKYFGSKLERDDLVTGQEHYTWNPPLDWDKFVNYREYYWLPQGPDSVPVLGQGQAVVSSYRVRSDGQNEWLFIPDGLKRNPNIILYRGQTYEFSVNAPGDPFYIRTSNLQGAPSNFNRGVTNNGAEVGKIIFTVPNDAPDLLYYQSGNNINRVGTFRIFNVNDNTYLDVDKEILGKDKYISTNGVKFSNGLKVEFIGNTSPEKYSNGSWIVEGVGESIRLVKFADLELPPISNPDQTVVFDDGGFDQEPFDDATSYPSTKDYITINRSSKDKNPWSRYNRWFHRSVIEYAASMNNSVPQISEDTRAKRPILEFSSDLQLFNHASVAKDSIDLIDDFTTDVFSTIEGTAGYNIDGVAVTDGMRILFTADTDPLVKNKIYVVNFITVQTSTNVTTRQQISLVEADDSVTQAGEGLIVKLGKSNAGRMYHFDGVEWYKSQLKTSVNQSPLFDVFDSEGVSLSDLGKYGTSSFAGTKIVGYKIGTGVVDKELGFPISYLNIENSGDILFEVSWETDTIISQIGTNKQTFEVASNFYRTNVSLTNFEYGNGWSLFDDVYYQPLIQVKTISESTDSVIFETCFWNTGTREEIYFYLNGKKITSGWTSQIDSTRKFTFNQTFVAGDVLTIKIYTDAEPDQGFYEFPIGLEKNPLNQDVKEFSLGQVNDHLGSMVELSKNFEGTYPGPSNLRDISDYRSYGRRFFKHSGISSISLPLLCDKTFNVVKALRFASSEYEKFKNTLLIKVLDLAYNNDDVISLFEDAITKLTSTKTKESPFVGSDMIGSGAYKSVKYIVEDEGITTFALTNKFDLSVPSDKAVYVYINNSQLLHGPDYEFDATFGFLKIKKPLVEDDAIEIREYYSTSFNFIPTTPTKLGLAKKYVPRIFVDDTYVTPTTVIQGHDGSITVAFNDYRDDILLELEKRIYNNIKEEYNPSLLDIDRIYGGYYGNSVFGKKDFDNLLASEFLKWSSSLSKDLYSNDYFDQDNPFTYTYSRASDLERSQQMPKHWRGIYRYLFDTDRPHTCPWEMLGFSEKPTWWEDEYGPAPYTSGNLLLWEDLRDGVIRQGPGTGINKRYSRPNLLSIIPVDENGKLRDPLSAGCIIDYSSSRVNESFRFGDVAPVENAWRKSSSYPFAVLIALCVQRPMEVISTNFDRNKIVRNIIGQLVDVDTNQFVNMETVKSSAVNGYVPTGLFSYILDYIRSNSVSTESLYDFFSNYDVKLSSRIGGFVDKTQQKYLLDSKNPRSKTSGVFIPQEDYEIFFNVSSPSAVVTYSGVIIEKSAIGYKVSGYDKLDSSFAYYDYFARLDDPTISVGGVTENYSEWTNEKFYSKGSLVKYNSKFFRVTQAHTSGQTFDITLFVEVGTVPLVGAVSAIKRTAFDKQSVLTMPYGTVLENIQSVVDFLLGYQEYLKDQGLVFDDYNTELQIANDWETSCKEFMFWTTHNWATGAIISLSPSALMVKINSVGNVADNILDAFYDYSIFRADGTKLPPEEIDVYRTYNEIIIAPSNIDNGIFYAKINFVLKEHVVIFNDRTIFNDVIFDKGPGYRQERIKVLGFRTSDWDGDYTSPGFIYDVANIKPWTQYTDYRLGDIVQYKQFNYVSKYFQKGVAEFDKEGWEKLDSTPTSGLVANFDYKINQIEDFYEVDYQGINNEQKVMARHSIGYQQREFLQNMAEDEVSQFRLYQGFIREKGTYNAITKVFDKISKIPEDAIELKEEWAFLLGSLGGTDQYKETEFVLKQSDLKLNPQPIILDDRRINKAEYRNYVILNQNSYKIGSNTYKFPTKDFKLGDWTAGYVYAPDVDYVVSNIADIYAQDVTTYKNGQTTWVTFTDTGWNVLRYRISNVIVGAVAIVDTTSVALETNRVHGIEVGTVIGLTNIRNLTGFYFVKAVGPTQIVVAIDGYKEEPEIDESSFCYIGYFIPARIPNSNPLISDEYSALPLGTRLWMDEDDQGRWNVIERRKQYKATEISEYGVSFPTGTGSAVEYLEARNTTIVSNPGSAVVTGDATRESAVIVYSQGPGGLVPLQVLNPQEGLKETFLGAYGDVLKTSKDGRWLLVGSPNVSYVPSNYRESYSPTANYNQGDTVVFAGKLWVAKRPVYSDGSTATFDYDDWAPATIHEANPLGKNIYDINQGYRQQGSVDVFEYDQGQYVFRNSLISPRPGHGEQFGSTISIGKREGIEGTSGDLVLTVNSIDSLGGIAEVSVEGVSGLSDAVFSNISGLDVSTSGENATFDVYRFGNNYTVTVRQGGTRYVVGDRLKIIGSRIGGVTPFNDLLITVTAVTSSGEILGSETYTNISGINSQLPTVAAVFNISKVRNIYSIVSTNPGLGYIPRSIVRYNSKLYACIKDTGIDRGVYAADSTYYPGEIVKYPELSSSYYKCVKYLVDSINPAERVGITGIDPTDTEYWEPAVTIFPTNTEYWELVSGGLFPTLAINWAEKDNKGKLIKYTAGTTIFVSGDQVGGTTPANDIIIRINKVENDTIADFSFRGTASTGITWTGSAASGEATYNDLPGEDVSEPGSGAIFNIIRTGGYYTAIVNVGGTRYAVGDQIKILGTSLGGVKEAYYMIIGAPGSRDDQGRGYIYIYEGVSWKHLEDVSFVGVFNPSSNYAAGDTVWYGTSYWKAITAQTGDGSTVPTTANWEQIVALNTGIIPKAAAFVDDGSTIQSGLVTDGIEFVNPGDRYSTSSDMNQTATVLVVGAPKADASEFDEYSGVWKSYQTYYVGQTVRRNSSYYTCLADTSINQIPEVNPSEWELETNVDTARTGAVFIYVKDEDDVYHLSQTLSSDTVSQLTTNESGDQFGHEVLLSSDGSLLYVSAPNVDANGADQGAVYVFKKSASGNYVFDQKIQSVTQDANERFGSTLSVSPDGVTLAIGAEGAETFKETTFDANNTYFDRFVSKFKDPQGKTGKVYVYNQYIGKYILSEIFEDGLTNNEDFGRSISVSNNSIIVGSPSYLSEDPAFEAVRIGRIQKFTKEDGVKSWTVVRKQSEGVDIFKIKNLSLYNGMTNIKIADVDVVDPQKGKLLSIIEQDIDYKTSYDPAIYSVGKENDTVDNKQPWLSNMVGKIWWNTSTTKWVAYEQGDTAFRLGNWNALAYGSSVDVYEWVETEYSPTEWNSITGTSTAFEVGISGTPLNGDETPYSTKEFVDKNTGIVAKTYYYYWVKDKATLSINSKKTNPASVISDYIESPQSSGLPFAVLLENDKMALYNASYVVDSDEFLVNIQFFNEDKTQNIIHNEYQLLSEGSVEGPTLELENKWLDSLIGEDILGNEVPDRKLTEKSRYGILARPRQTMFVNRNQAVRTTIDYINSILASYPLADNISYENLNSVDTAPSTNKNLYDLVYDTYEEIALLNVVKIKTATLKANIINGHINTVDVIDPGYGYHVPPTIKILGTGEGAVLESVIDGFGRVTSVNVIKPGKKYTEARLQVRSFAILVNSDSTVDGFWSIWSFNDRTKDFYRSATQSHDTTKFWSTVDWWADGFNEKSRIRYNLQGVYAEPEVDLLLGELLRLEDYGSGGWAVFERTDINPTLLGKYRLVGRELGTIQISDKFYNTEGASYGYDQTQSFDSNKFDTSSAIEFRNILRAVKEDIFVNELANEWNKLFFVNIHYIFSEQMYVNWAFKTSFMTATHNVGYLAEKLNYKSDNLDSFQDYINEVKPYRTKIRKYTSRYLGVDNAGLLTSDFDLPPSYDVDTNKINPVRLGDSLIDQYPWKNWFDNYKFSIVDVTILDQGSTYTTVPQVIFEGGGGTGAKAQAFISSGKVSGIKLISGGYGYTTAPTVKIVGGVGSNEQNAAKAVAVIGDSKARTFDMTVKFDRYSKQGKFTASSKNEKFIENETFLAGKNSYDLKYPPTSDKSKISVEVGGKKLLRNEYSITLFTKEVNGYSQLRGRLVLPKVASGAVVVSYEKNDQILDALNRLDKYYKPKSGMLGFEKTEVLDDLGNVVEVKGDYSQLMTGIDFGGVIVQGATFDVGAGWDALPWFTEGWDSSETLESDFYIAADGSTHAFNLPEILSEGQQLNIYQKKKSTGKTTRLDPDQMPTYVADGSSSVVFIPDEILVQAGDVFIFRKPTSDGSLTIGGRNLLDANVSGGSLSGMDPYSTALGTTAAEIVVDGEKFVSPDHVPAPEEQVPGQVLEAVSIKVFHSDRTGSPAVLSNVYIADGATSLFDIGQTIIEQESVLVTVDKVSKILGMDYVIDSPTNKVRFIGTAPIVDSVVEIFSISVGGVGILDVKEFTGDGKTRYFLTGASFEETGSVFASIDGSSLTVGWVNSNGRVNDIDNTLVEFGAPPAVGRKIVVIILSSAVGEQSLVRLKQEEIVLDGSTRTYPIQSFLGYEATATGSVVVDINALALTSVDTVYVSYNAVNEIPIGIDPFRDYGSIIESEIRVYFNNQLKTFGVDYIFNGDTNIVTIIPEPSGITHGDIIRIEDYSNPKYTIESIPSTTPTWGIVLDSSVVINDGDVMRIFWAERYPEADLLKDEYTGGRVSYALQRPTVSLSYVRVYQNGLRLTPDIDYYLGDANTAVYIKNETTSDDIIEIITYSNNYWKPPVSWEIFKDVLNQNHFSRYVINEVSLAKALNYYDTEIELTDATNFVNPMFDKPGIVTISGEKIQYFQKDGNVLKQIKRGLFGTSIGNSYLQGTLVVDTGYTEAVPYKETQEKEDFISDGNPDDSTVGTAKTIGPLNFVPIKTEKADWYRDTIPATHGLCDQIEVFVGGRRLRKNPTSLYDPTVGSDSPQGDVQVEAEYSVDGSTAYVRLTTTPPAGQRVTVIRRIGAIWYTQGPDSAASGKGLSQSTTAIVKFLQQSATKLPE